MQIKGGKVDIATAVKLMKGAFGADDPRVAMAQDIATECFEVTDPDRCEAAAKMYTCGREGAVRRGYTFEDFL